MEYKSLLNESELDLRDVVLGGSSDGILKVTSSALGTYALSGQFSTIGDTISVINLNGLNTGMLTEGSNLYFTDARSRAAISAGLGILYNSSTGVISLPQAVDLTSTVQFGKVGIGESSPDFKLVARDAVSTAQISARYNGTLPANYKELQLGYNGASGNGYGWIQAIANGVAYTPLVLQQYGGNVGINNTSPTDNRICINSSSQQISFGTADASNGMWIRNDGWNTVFSAKQGSMYYGYAGASGIAHLFYSGTGTPSETMRIADNKVGIGVAPSFPFHVKSATNAQIVIDDNSGGTAELRHYNSGVITSTYFTSSSGSRLRSVTNIPLYLGYNNGEQVKIGDSTNGYPTAMSVTNGSSGPVLKIQETSASGRGHIQIGSSATGSNNVHIGCEGNGAFYAWNGVWGAGTEMMQVTSTQAAFGSGVGSNVIQIRGNDAAGGSSLNILNSSKTGGNSNSWSIYNMGASYGNGLQFWYYPVSGGAYRSLNLQDSGNVSMERGSLTVYGTYGSKNTAPTSAAYTCGNTNVGASSSYANYSLLMYDSGAAADSYGIGIDSYTLWANSYRYHKWTSRNTQTMQLDDAGRLAFNGMTAYATLSLLGSASAPLAGICLGGYGYDTSPYHRLELANGGGNYHYYMSQNIVWSAANNRWEFVVGSGWGGYGGMFLFSGYGQAEFSTATNVAGLPSFKQNILFQNNGNCAMGYNLTVTGSIQSGAFQNYVDQAAFAQLYLNGGTSTMYFASPSNAKYTGFDTAGTSQYYTADTTNKYVTNGASAYRGGYAKISATGSLSTSVVGQVQLYLYDSFSGVTISSPFLISTTTTTEYVPFHIEMIYQFNWKARAELYVGWVSAGACTVTLYSPKLTVMRIGS